MKRLSNNDLKFHTGKKILLKIGDICLIKKLIQVKWDCFSVEIETGKFKGCEIFYKHPGDNKFTFYEYPL